MTKEEHAIPVDVRLSHVEVAPDQRYQKRIKHVVDEFGKYFFALAQVSLAALLALQSWRFKPTDFSDLETLTKPEAWSTLA